MARQPPIFMRSPTRSPAWRWDLVSGSVELDSRGFPGCDDALMARAVEYCHRRNKIHGAGHRSTSAVLLAAFPDISWADSLHMDSSVVKYMLEALVLARVTAEDIANRFGLPVEYVNAYESLFFDIRDRLDNPTMIAATVLHPFLSGGLTSGNDIDQYWKAVSYFGGLEMLETLWMVGPKSEKVRKWFVEAFKGGAVTNLLKTPYVRQVNTFNASEIVHEHIDMEKQEAEAAAKSGVQSKEIAVNNTLELLVHTSAFTVAEPTARGYLAEPRAHENALMITDDIKLAQARLAGRATVETVTKESAND